LGRRYAEKENDLTHLGKDKVDGDCEWNSDRNEDHVVSPANGTECERSGGSRPDGREEKCDVRNGSSLTAEVGRPDFAPVHVARALNCDGIEEGDEEVNGDCGLGASRIVPVKVLCLERGLNREKSGIAETTSDYDRLLV
jgi:hypothetical protein